MEPAVQNDGEVVLKLGRGEITVFVWMPANNGTESKGIVLAHGSQPYKLLRLVRLGLRKSDESEISDGNFDGCDWLKTTLGDGPYTGDGSGCWDTESYQEGEVEVEFTTSRSRGLDDKVVSSKRHMLAG